MDAHEANDGQCCRLRQVGKRQGDESPEAETKKQQATSKHNVRGQVKLINQSIGKSSSQTSSFILFASVIILINLCSYHVDFFAGNEKQPAAPAITSSDKQTNYVNINHHEQSDSPIDSTSLAASQAPIDRRHLGDETRHTKNYRSGNNYYLTYLESCLEFVKLMFRQPMRLNRRTTRFTLAEARVLGKMAKVWYIKKKIKKLSKKLKKHTIAVPVFTAIPIYEHSYYPQPHVTHVSHSGGMHHAASSYSPAAASAPSATSGSLATAASSPQGMATSASNQHHQMTAATAAAYRMAAHASHPAARSSMYGHHPVAAGSHHHIINAYAPSPPLYVDDAGGLYGHYGNAYGRYDGGYHIW